MDKFDWQKKRIVDEYGQPEYGGQDGKEPLNDSAKKIQALQLKQLKHISKKRPVHRLTNLELSAVKHIKAVPIELTESDLTLFTPEEREIVQAYFENTNLTVEDLSNKFNVSRYNVTKLMRSGPFAVLTEKMFNHVAQLQVKWSLLKLIDSQNPKIVERLAENFGVLKNQELNLNMNKALDLPEDVLKKLKDIGDHI